ncbi:hypothetical protein ACJRO7_027302 [Eucalyptus globulus]|uniref:Uncharacterized protein n=1 Tax=Eucalyptus globulus TaxID=34317 RepID=A0ABD3JQQ2_EUCGL
MYQLRKAGGLRPAPCCAGTIPPPPATPLPDGAPQAGRSPAGTGSAEAPGIRSDSWFAPSGGGEDSRKLPAAPGSRHGHSEMDHDHRQHNG